MTPEEQRSLVKQTVTETLLQLGVDVTEPEQVLEFQRDLQHLRKWRKTVETVESRSALAIVLTLISGIAAAAWLGFQQMVSKGG